MQILEFINTNLSIPLWFVFFYFLVEDWRFSRKTMRWLPLLVLLGLSVTQAMIFFWVKEFPLNRILMLANACGWGLVFALNTTKYRNGQVLFICMTNFSLLLIGGVFSECIGTASTVTRLILKLGINLLIVLFVFFLFRPTVLRLLREATLNWYIFSLVPLLFAVLLLLLLVPGKLHYDRELQLLAVTLALSLCGCYIAIYRIFRTLKDGYDLKADNELLRSQMAHLQSQAETLQNAYNQVRIFRHDMRHFMQIQAACLDSGDTDGARALLSTMQENLDVGLNSWAVKSYTGKPLLDAVLSNYTHRAEKAGIAFGLEFSLPEPLPAPADELAVVLANALENALNACMRIPPKDFRGIKLQGIQNGEQYLLVVSNTFHGIVEFNHTTGLPVTHEEGHGYGTQSIAAFAKHHGAALDYAVKDGWFSLRILF